MTVYDATHELARQLRESREYIEYKEMKDIIYADPKLKEQVEEFEKIKYEMQMLTIQEGKQDEQKMAKLQELFQIGGEK